MLTKRPTTRLICFDPKHTYLKYGHLFQKPSVCRSPVTVMIFPQSALLPIWNLGNRYAFGITAVCQSMKAFNLWSHPCGVASCSACKVRSKLVSISLTHFPGFVVPRRAKYLQYSEQKIILQVYSFVSRPNYRILAVIMWGESVAERLSSFSNSWRQGWSWEGEICNKIVDNTVHGHLSKR